MNKLLKPLASLKITIACLVCFMILVLLGTLDQVNLGIYYAQKRYFQTLWVMWPTSWGWHLPIMPGGFLVSLVLSINCVAALLTRFTLKGKQIGLVISHLGVLVLLLGGGISYFVAIESQIPIFEGETKNYSQDTRRFELALIRISDSHADTVLSIPGEKLEQGGVLSHPDIPLRIRVKAFFPNTQLKMKAANLNFSRLPDVTQGIGTRLQVTPIERFYRDETPDNPTAYIEILAGEQSLGTWMVAHNLAVPQSFKHGQDEYTLAIRSYRYYEPYTLMLKDFAHDRYAGTNVPKNYSSQIHLSDPIKGEERDVLIYMNNPLRYRGKTFYQASFGEEDTMSVLQVVENPSWLLPYISCTMIALGLLIHFLSSLIRFTKARI